MIRHFQSNREAFEELRGMFGEDRMLAVGADFSRPFDRPNEENGLSAERHQAYRDNFQKLGIIAGYWNSEGLDLMASTHGISISGEVKGYTWRAAPLQDVVPSLDNIPDSYYQRSFFELYRPIEGGWYLFLEWDR